MKRTYSDVTNKVVVLLAAFLLVAPKANAQEKRIYAKSGFYIGVTAPRNSVEGSFDGESVLTGGGEIIFVPKVVSNFGVGALIGGRAGKSALELSYQRSRHNVTFMEATGKADYHVLGLEARYYLVSKEAVQPFVLIGGVLDWLVVREGSATEDKLGDATFEGGGFSFGGGLAIYVHPRISISGEGSYRLIGYGGEHAVKGVLNEWTAISGDFSGGGVNAALGLRFTF